MAAGGKPLEQPQWHARPWCEDCRSSRPVVDVGRALQPAKAGARSGAVELAAISVGFIGDYFSHTFYTRFMALFTGAPCCISLTVSSWKSLRFGESWWWHPTLTFSPGAPTNSQMTRYRSGWCAI